MLVLSYICFIKISNYYHVNTDIYQIIFL
jgi:hypothetical protein